MGSGCRLAQGSPPGSPEIPWTLDASGTLPDTEPVALGQLLAVEVGPLVALLQVLPVGEGVSLLNQGQAGAPPIGGEDLGDSASVAVLGLGFQRDRGSDREESLESFPRLLPVRRLRHLGGVDTGDTDRELLPAVLHAQRVAVTD